MIELAPDTSARPLVLRAAGCALAIALLTASLSHPAQAADSKMISVDWTNPEIGAFVQRRLTAAAEPRDAELRKLDKVQLPVLGFDAPPATVTNAIAATAREARQRKVIIDEKNPVWYQLIDRYGDMVVTVEADLRIQQELPANTPIYGAGAGGAGASPQSSISVFDGRSEPGMEGAIAEYTIFKYPNIPYKVTIECPPDRTASCRDLDTIAKDQQQLKLIAAQPPR